MVSRHPLYAEIDFRPGRVPTMPGGCHQCGDGLSGYRLRDADGRRKELDLSATRYHREGHHHRDQPAVGADLGSSAGTEGTRHRECGMYSCGNTHTMTLTPDAHRIYEYRGAERNLQADRRNKPGQGAEGGQ